MTKILMNWSGWCFAHWSRLGIKETGLWFGLSIRERGACNVAGTVSRSM